MAKKAGDSVPTTDSKTSARKGGRWKKRLAIAVPVAVAIYALIGFFVVPWVAQRWVVPMVADSLINGDVQVDTIRTNPFTLSLTLEGVAVTDEQGTKVVGLDRLYGNLQASSLFREGFVLRTVALERPFLLAVLNEDGSLNLASLFKSSDEPSEPITLPRVRGESLTIDDGQVEFVDRMIAGAPDRTIEPISFTVGVFDTQPLHANMHRFSAATEAAENVTWEGQVLLNPLEATGTIVVRGFDLSVYEPYLRRYAHLDLNQGQASLELTYELAPSKSPRAASATLKNLTVTGLNVALPKHPLLSFETFSIEDAVADAVARTLTVQRVSVVAPDATVQREADGSLALLDLVDALVGTSADASNGSSPATLKKAGAQRENLALIPPDAADGLPRPLDEALRGVIETANAATASWTLSVEQISVDAAKARWRDFAVEPNVELAVAETTFSAGPIRTATDYVVDFQLDTAVASGGTAKITGRVEPLASRATIATLQTTGLILAPIAPYVQQADDRLRLPEGTLDLTGSQITAGMGEASGDNAAVPTIAIGEFTVGGAIDLQVHGFGPPLDVSLRDLQLSLSGLDTAAGSAATIGFGTRIYDGSIAIDGTTLPNLAEPLKSTIDLNIVVDKFALRPLSPVSGEYVGRAIQEGTLNTKPDDALTIKLIEQHLEAMIPLRIASFNFGDKVASGNATSLPVGLAVAILKGPDGTISPPPIRISGDLSDPSISVAGIVMHALTNVVVGVASSPFQMLGGLVPGASAGGGEAPDLSFVAFAPGSADLTAETTGKLDLLGKAMQERPALGLAVKGLPTRSLDEPPLRRAAFIRALQEKKAQTLDTGDAQRQNPETIPVGDEQYRDAVRFAHAAMASPETSESATPTRSPAAADADTAVDDDAASTSSDSAAPADPPATEAATESAATPPSTLALEDSADAAADDGQSSEASEASEATNTPAAEASRDVAVAEDQELVRDEPTELRLELPVLGSSDGGAAAERSARRAAQEETRTRRLRAGRTMHSGVARASSSTVETSDAVEANGTGGTGGSGGSGDEAGVPATSASYDETLMASTEAAGPEAASAEVAMPTDDVPADGDDVEMPPSAEDAVSADAVPGSQDGPAAEEAAGSAGVDSAEPAVPFEEADRAVLAQVPLDAQAFVALRQRRVQTVADYLIGVAGLPTSRVVASDAPASLETSGGGGAAAVPASPRVVFEPTAD